MVNTNATSPLMAEAEGNEVPNLGGTDLESEEYQSPLERLIAQSTSEQRGDSFAVPTQWDDRDNNNDLMMNTSNTTCQQTQIMYLQSPILAPPSTPKPSLVTFAACTCCLLQMGFIWASFLSSSWLDTRLFLSVSLPSIQVKTDNSQLLHSTTLGSLLGNLLGAGRHWAAMALVLTSLVLPCLCAVSGAIWVVEDRKEQYKIIQAVTANNTNSLKRRLQRNGQYNCISPRMFIEYSARIGFSVFFMLCILDIGISPLEIEFNDSRFIVVNQIKGGMAAYSLGMICTLFVMALLRLGKINSNGIFAPTAGTAGNSNNTTVQDLYHEQYFEGKTRRNQDFECSWQVHSNELFTDARYADANENDTGNEEFEMQTPLLQDEYYNDSSLMAGNSLFSAIEDATETLDDNSTETMPIETGSLPLWKRVVLYELALLSTLLWLPALFLPLFQIKYEGIVSDFMTEVSLSFRLWDFPVELWERGVSAGTDRWILFILEMILLLLVFICPILANLSAIGAWIFDTHSRTFCQNLLWIIQPCVSTIVFGVALHFSIPAFETVTERVIDKVSSGICNNFELITTDTCLTIQAEPSVGLWFLLGEALALEVFVVLTLAWKIRYSL